MITVLRQRLFFKTEGQLFLRPFFSFMLSVKSSLLLVMMEIGISFSLSLSLSLSFPLSSRSLVLSPHISECRRIPLKCQYFHFDCCCSSFCVSLALDEKAINNTTSTSPSQPPLPSQAALCQTEVDILFMNFINKLF